MIILFQNCWKPRPAHASNYNWYAQIFLALRDIFAAFHSRFLTFWWQRSSITTILGVLQLATAYIIVHDFSFHIQGLGFCEENIVSFSIVLLLVDDLL
ncbi:hypothetical protein CIPAW_03G100900 [Carya illinoinensis]|uniref:Uncharacterized protein n=1 Tax=Carya illinoinensis TaxID=32201 RepID=A0A8T1R0Z8_CARIL|nr:hypothetical protein CIPAW_03G100900 [Carya illinoinensis]KAG6660365.1 hypothetical protein CIPAW_03G100900 [Carya illinoinensis]